MRDDPHFRETKGAHEGREVLSVHIGGPIRHTIRTCFVRIVIAAAVGDNVIATRKSWKMIQPHAIVLQAAVDKYYRLALAQLNICKRSAVSRNSLEFISRGHGVVIHTRECPKALDLDPLRRVDVSWDDESKAVRPVAVQVTCSDRPGLLAAISKSFTEHGVNISQARCRTSEDGRAVNTFQVTVGHLDQLEDGLHAVALYSLDRVRARSAVAADLARNLRAG